MTDDTSPAATRWAGVALAVSGLSLFVTIALYGAVFGAAEPSVPGGEPTIVDQATHVLENWGFVSRLWVAELTCYVVIAISAVVLVAESGGGAGWLPRRVAWAAVGVGSTLQAAMYAFLLGGYPSAIEAAESVPALFGVLRDSAFLLFYVGNAAIFFGFAGVFMTEAGTGIIFSKRTGWIGGLICLSTLILILGVAGGIISIVAAAPFALIAHLLIGYAGVALFRRGGSASAS